MKKYLLVSGVILFVFFFFLPVHVDAAYLKFDETEVTANVNDTLHSQVIVDAGSDQIVSSDVYVVYDATVLEAQSVGSGSFFPTVTHNITSGKIYIAGLVDDPATFKTGSGTLATVTFKAIKAGTATLSFFCDTNVYNTSKIIKNDFNSTNIIVCSQNTTSTVTVGGRTTDGESTARTAGQSTSSLPQSGVLDNLLKYSLPGAALFLIGWGLKLLL